ncbi:MAG: hypothetical protein ABW252_12995 [Polyangiales bacterium]
MMSRSFLASRSASALTPSAALLVTWASIGGCTGVVTPPSTTSAQTVIETDGGEAPPSTDVETDPATPSGDAGSSPRDGGATRDAGRDGGKPPTQRSSGCGKPGNGSGAFERRTVRIRDRDRTYHVRIPDDYSATRAYPVVFRFHGIGGDGLAGGLDIERATGDDAIVVGADGVNRGWHGGTQAEDVELFDTMLATLSSSYCVDVTRVFAYGFSMGGGFTNLLGCLRADKLRATATVAGFDRSDARCAEQPMASWYQHDQGDPAAPISGGRAARDRVLRRNDCGSETRSADGCVTYTDCDGGEPVVWCETQGLGHDIDGSRAPQKVWTFFSSLP